MEAGIQFINPAGCNHPARGSAASAFSFRRAAMVFPKTIQWRGQTYQVPSMSEIEEWVLDSVCETPEGDCVEPDHPDSWLSLLGII
jgi:hypothetical protein